MKQHLQKSERVRTGGKWLTKAPKRKPVKGYQYPPALTAQPYIPSADRR
jgi:hypothetical protein